MRNLILCRGAAGSGKTTWLDKNGLSQYAINVDNVRLMFQSPVMTIDGSTEISQKNDNKVWEFVRQIIEERMKRGETTIVDATHSRSSLINDYKKLCEKYRYRCTVVEFNNDLETILKQNSQRIVYKQVPEHVIANMVERIKSQSTPNWCTKVSVEKFWETYATTKKFDFNKYKNVVHIGDLHGCYEPLKEYFEQYPFSQDNFYIFLGDYFDRGIQHKELLTFLMSIMNEKNVLLLEGNHEQWARFYADDNLDSIRSKEFSKYTIPQISSFDKKEIREFCRRLGQLAYYEFHGKTIFCNHGGYPVLPNPFSVTDDFIKGVGKYEDCLTVEDAWNTIIGEENYQVHAHRNVDNLPIKNGNCYNLCDTIEFGGNLRILTIDENGDFVPMMIKNNVFFINEAPPAHVVIDKEHILDSLLNNKLIQTKKLTEHIVSLNFTREAFQDREWNDLTTIARGLFVNTATKEIVARSYRKFFNEGENSANDLQELKRTMIFPAVAYLKYGGYLGIVGYDSETDELFVATKSSNQGDMQKEFRRLLFNTANGNDLKTLCKNNNVSLIFECLDPINDPHIIEYNKQQIVLLDCVDRTWDFNRSLSLSDVANEFGFQMKETAYILKDYNDFYNLVKDCEDYNFKHNNESVEGFVVEDGNGYMIKVKTKYYKFWKFMRSLKERLGRGNVVDTAWLNEAMQNKVFAFLKSKDRDYLAKHSIIELRNEFETQ